MKNKFNKLLRLLFLLMVILFINSCTKDQSSVRKLDGTWEVESVTYAGKKPTELFIYTDFSKGAKPCTVGAYEKIKKIWFYKCNIKEDGACDWVDGYPVNCNPAVENWCIGNVRFPDDPNACGGHSDDGDSFISFQYRIEQKGKKLVTRKDADMDKVLGYDIISLDRKKVVLEYKTDTLSYTVTLKSIKDDKNKNN